MATGTTYGSITDSMHRGQRGQRVKRRTGGRAIQGEGMMMAEAVFGRERVGDGSQNCASTVRRAAEQRGLMLEQLSEPRRRWRIQIASPLFDGDHQLHHRNPAREGGSRDEASAPVSLARFSGVGRSPGEWGRRYQKLARARDEQKAQGEEFFGTEYQVYKSSG